MIELKQTSVFAKWLLELRDKKTRTVIAARLDRLAYGLVGDVEPIGGGLSELRIHLGPGYRIYLRRQGNRIIILLCGGDKASQARDIKTAQRLAAEWSE